MKYIIILCVLLTGCARTECELSINNLQPMERIPKVANIAIGDTIQADDGGIVLLKGYSRASKQIDAIKQSCSE